MYKVMEMNVTPDVIDVLILLFVTISIPVTYIGGLLKGDYKINQSRSGYEKFRFGLFFVDYIILAVFCVVMVIALFNSNLFAYRDYLILDGASVFAFVSYIVMAFIDYSRKFCKSHQHNSKLDILKFVVDVIIALLLIVILVLAMINEISFNLPLSRLLLDFRIAFGVLTFVRYIPGIIIRKINEEPPRYY